MVTATKTSAPGQVRDAASAKLRPKIETLEARIEPMEERRLVIQQRLAVLPRLEEVARAKALDAGESSWASTKLLADERLDLEGESESLGHDLMGLQSDLRVLRQQADKAEAEAVLAGAKVIVERQWARVEQAAGEFSARCAELFDVLNGDEAELAEWCAALREMGRANWAPKSGLENLDSPEAVAHIVAERAR